MARYLIDDVEYVSPTEILGLLGKGDALLYWASDLALKHNDRNAFKKFRDNTKDIGHDFHTIVESFINMKIQKIKNESFMKQEVFNDYNLHQMFLQFYSWQKKNVKQFIKTEGQVVHEDLCYAGTYDFIWEDFDDMIHLTDLKTKNVLYGEEKFQLSAYKEAYESMEKETYKIHNKVNGNEWDVILKHVPLKIDYIDILKISRDYFEEIELKDFSIDHERNFQAFDGLLDYFYYSAKRKLNNKRVKEMELI